MISNVNQLPPKVQDLLNMIRSTLIGTGAFVEVGIVLPEIAETDTMVVWARPRAVFKDMLTGKQKPESFEYTLQLTSLTPTMGAGEVVKRANSASIAFLDTYIKGNRKVMAIHGKT